MIKRAIEEGASDIHFEPQAERMLVRARIDGVMVALRIVPEELQQAVTTRMKIMGELDIAERRMPQDGRVSIRFGGEPMDIRVAVLPTTHGEQIVLRILYRAGRSKDFSQLGLAEDTIETLIRAIEQPYGCVISCGPTGSGKTTTLYAALDMLNDPERVVMTIEDPVEFQLEGVNQIQVNPRAGLTFAKGLRTVLRSDPDVLLIGEIRDDETAKIAVQAAMTGHLVLTTLHADNVGTSVARLKDMGVEPSLLASTVNCIFAQRLVRKLCAACREPYEVEQDAARELRDRRGRSLRRRHDPLSRSRLHPVLRRLQGPDGPVRDPEGYAEHAPPDRDCDCRGDLRRRRRERYAHAAAGRPPPRSRRAHLARGGQASGRRAARVEGRPYRREGPPAGAATYPRRVAAWPSERTPSIAFEAHRGSGAPPPLVLVLVLGGLAGGGAWLARADSGHLPPGVEIGGVDVGGLSVADARESRRSGGRSAGRASRSCSPSRAGSSRRRAPSSGSTRRSTPRSRRRSRAEAVSAG